MKNKALRINGELIAYYCYSDKIEGLLHLQTVVKFWPANVDSPQDMEDSIASIIAIVEQRPVTTLSFLNVSLWDKITL